MTEQQKIKNHGNFTGWPFFISSIVVQGGFNIDDFWSKFFFNEP